ncbi:hypothetical protein ACTIVE_5146 [Actinomadura verrucosospora]|uniref:Uncharacterized protein n=1 Tax=Actinomadura verrucosospora TaxID=46165 RepID=A0A7D3ZNS5_ACTVE|nr:hypothetical protein ACTIVE_5146 [Actinomadura verrucosospora]
MAALLPLNLAPRPARDLVFSDGQVPSSPAVGALDGTWPSPTPDRPRWARRTPTPGMASARASPTMASGRVATRGPSPRRYAAFKRRQGVRLIRRGGPAATDDLPKGLRPHHAGWRHVTLRRSDRAAGSLSMATPHRSTGSVPPPAEAPSGDRGRTPSTPPAWAMCPRTDAE